MPTATLNAHFGVTNTVTTVHQTRSSLGLKRFVMPGGPTPVPYIPEQPQDWQSAGAAIREYVAAQEWEKIEKRIRNLRRKLNEDLSKEDEKATRARLKALRQELQSREQDLAADLRDQLNDLREGAEEAAQTFIEALQDKVDQAREAESAALSALQDAQAAESQALQTLNDLIAQRQQFKDAIAESFRSQASVTGFSFADIDSLTGGRDAAQQALFDARRAYNRALGTTDEAEALERLNEAKKAAAAADTALAEGQAQNTPGGILASMAKKVAQVKSLATNLRKMRDMGYPVPIIQDILNQGLEGARLAEVLATADPGTVAQFQAMQAEVTAAGADLGELGYALAGSPMDAAIAQAQAAYQAAAGATASAGEAYAAAQAGVAAAVAYMNTYVGANGELLQPIQVSLSVDGRTLVETLVNYRRSIGGAPLGLG